MALVASSMFKQYYQLTKPGIIYGNAITVVAGFLLASKTHPNLLLLLATLIGVSLVIGASCVYNNYIDRNIDKQMQRTKNRALVTQTIPVKNALIFGTVLGILGFATLAVFTNWLTVLVGLIGVIDYVILYGISKRTSVHGTLVGSISGAMPLVSGYTAVTNRFDAGAWILFIILAVWQMPHFYAIAMYRVKDYAKASIPVLPVKKGPLITKIHTLLYVVLFVISTLLLTFFGVTGKITAIVLGFLGIGWLVLSIQGFMTKNDTRWARKMFFFSLIALLIFSAVISVDSILPKI